MLKQQRVLYIWARKARVDIFCDSLGKEDLQPNKVQTKKQYLQEPVFDYFIDWLIKPFVPYQQRDLLVFHSQNPPTQNQSCIIRFPIRLCKYAKSNCTSINPCMIDCSCSDIKNCHCGIHSSILNERWNYYIVKYRNLLFCMHRVN